MLQGLKLTLHIQPTLPVRGATMQKGKTYFTRIDSTHAPREGSDHQVIQ